MSYPEYLRLVSIGINVAFVDIISQYRRNGNKLRGCCACDRQKEENQESSGTGLAEESAGCGRGWETSRDIR